MVSIDKFGYIRTAAVTPVLELGNVEANVVEIERCLKICYDNSVSLVVFPELCITGYSLGDLFFQTSLLNDAFNSITQLSRLSKIYDITFIVGIPLKVNSKLYNCAALFNNGKMKGIIPKTYLCNYGEFYEERWFSSADDKISDYLKFGKNLVPFGKDILFEDKNNSGIIIGMEICEDLWAIKPPSLDMAVSGANLIFNLSASNEYLGKYQYRKDLVRVHSSKIIAGYVYCSSGPWESSSDTVYSGSSIIAENGKILSESDRFSFDREITIGDIDIDFIVSERLKNNSFGFSKTNSDFRIIEISINSNPVDNLERKISKTPFIPSNDNERDNVCSEISNLQATALARRFLHTNANSAVIGISGGLDSTLALLSTIKAFEKINKPLNDIIAINMPGFGTTNKTKSNAEKLADEFGVTFKSISINDSVNQHFKDISHDDKVHDITYENAQARMRTMILMDIANQSNGLVIGTGDLSEIALGWNTFNGDQMSMYGLNSGVPKSLVKYIIKWYAEKVYDGNISDILTDILNTPVSPELLPLDNEGNNPQETEKTIGPYILHDFFLYNFVRCSFSTQKVQFLANITFKNEFSEKEIEKWLRIFIKRFFSQQFKRNSMPDGMKIGTVSLSQRTDWRMPSDIRYESWLNEINNGEINAV